MTHDTARTPRSSSGLPTAVPPTDIGLSKRPAGQLGEPHRATTVPETPAGLGAAGTADASHGLCPSWSHTDRANQRYGRGRPRRPDGYDSACTGGDTPTGTDTAEQPTPAPTPIRIAPASFSGPARILTALTYRTVGSV